MESLGGFPVLVRPSYVLSGAAMRVADSETELTTFLSKATDISPEHPVTISKFENNSREVEFDAVAHNGVVKLYAISEHIENAGVHSGDATLVFPSQRLTLEVMHKVKKIGERLAKELNITGPFNVQMLARDHSVKVIECNLRASRSFPYISKALGVNFIREATSLMLSGKMTRKDIETKNILHTDYVVVKAPQFSFSRLKGADPRLGVEMASTGEVACFGRDTSEALLAAMLASGFKTPKSGVLISLEQEADRASMVTEVQLLVKAGLNIYATPETAEIFKQHGVACESVNVSALLGNDKAPLIEFLKSGKVDMIVSVPGAAKVTSTEEGYWLRRMAVDLELSFITDLWLAKRTILAFTNYTRDDIAIKAWNDYHSEQAVSEEELELAAA